MVPVASFQVSFLGTMTAEALSWPPPQPQPLTPSSAKIMDTTSHVLMASCVINLQEVGGGCGDWMELAQDKDRWRALVSTFGFQKFGEFLD